MLGHRIQRARKAQGLSLRALGQEVALSHAAIKKYEDNQATPSSDMLIKLSKALHVKTEYFFRPERFTLNNIKYRYDADIPKRQLNEITAKILDQIERRVELENLFPSPQIQSFSVKKLPTKIKNPDDIEALSETIREEWNLGLNPITDLIDIIEEHGIKVFQMDNLHYPKFDGLYADVNDIPVIVVSTQCPGDSQRFTLAHELGHLFLKTNLARGLKLENYCNHFAGAFLLPKQSLINFLGKHRNYVEPRELSLIKQEFGISMTSILHRLQETEIINDNLYRQLRSEFNERGWDKHEPGEQYPREKTHILEQMIFHALAEEYIGESKAAELMNLSLESFRSLRAMESQNVTAHQ